jgi:hypothetical protein
MNDKQFVQSYLALIISKYGETLVSEALTDLIGSSEKKSEKPLTKEKQNNTKINLTKSKQFQELEEKHPDKFIAVKDLMERFENKTFLPELKDIKRFLEKQGLINSSSIKSRKSAESKITQTLFTLPVEELEIILSSPVNDEHSSLGIIADEILRRD